MKKNALSRIDVNVGSMSFGLFSLLFSLKMSSRLGHVLPTVREGACIAAEALTSARSSAIVKFVELVDEELVFMSHSS